MHIPLLDYVRIKSWFIIIVILMKCQSSGNSGVVPMDTKPFALFFDEYAS